MLADFDLGFRVMCVAFIVWCLAFGCSAAAPPAIGPDATGTCRPGPAPVLIGCTEDAAECERSDSLELLYLHCQLPADPSIGRLSYWCVAKCAEVYTK